MNWDKITSGLLIVLAIGAIVAMIGFLAYDISGYTYSCDQDPLMVMEVGGCHSNKEGGGSCGTILSNGRYVRLTAPVRGELVIRCVSKNRAGEVKDERYKRAN